MIMIRGAVVYGYKQKYLEGSLTCQISKALVVIPLPGPMIAYTWVLIRFAIPYRNSSLFKPREVGYFGNNLTNIVSAGTS